MKKDFFKDYVSKWLLYLKVVKGVSVNTLKAYSEDIENFETFFQEYFGERFSLQQFETLTISHLRAFVSHQQQKERDIRSTARGLSAVKNFIRYLVQEKVIADHALLSFKIGRIRKKLPRALSQLQALELMENIQMLSDIEWIQARDKALMLLLYSTGLRISEALSICLSDIERTFISVVGKGGKIRQVPLLENVKVAIHRYIGLCPYFLHYEEHTVNKSHTESPIVFKTITGKNLSPSGAQALLRQYRRTFGLPETTTPHALRHTCATHLVEASGDLRAIQDLLGHASLSSTQLYTNLADQKVREVFKLTHPRQTLKKEE